MSHSTASPCDRVHREDTLNAYQRGVERAIQRMHARFGEPLTVHDLAAAALMSRYHFTRIFTTITGVSPARFLAAIRMQEAKRMLLKTDRSVTDICFDVGYNSLGTFIRIFADFVGFPPVRFRQLSLALLGLTIENAVRFIPPTVALENPSISGEIACDTPLALITVALFPTSVPRSRPIECNCLTDTQHFAFKSRPPREARILAAGVTQMATMEDVLLMCDRQIVVGTVSNLRVANTEFKLRLWPRRPVEPPIVVAFPLLTVESTMRAQTGTLGEAWHRHIRDSSRAH